LIRSLDMRIAELLQTGAWPQLALWFGVGTATLQPIGQLLEITGSMAGAAVIGVLLAGYSKMTAGHVFWSSQSRRQRPATTVPTTVGPSSGLFGLRNARPPMTRPLRVLHVIPSVSPRDGGPTRAIGIVERALKEVGVEVTTLTTDHNLWRNGEA